MDMSSVEEDQVVHDATQVVGNNRASTTMMELHDVLRNIEQMFVAFKHYIEAFEAGMAQARPMAQAPQALLLLKPLMQKSLSLLYRRSLMGFDQSFMVLCNRSISFCGFIFFIILMTPRKWLS
jgi:hypothetical protein